MIRIGLRDARGHLGRFAMSIVAIMLGVAFIVGAFSLSSLMGDQVSSMFVTSYDHDVYVEGPTSSKKGSDSGSASAMASTMTEQASVPVSLASKIRKVRGVTSATAVPVLRMATLVGADGSAVATRGSSMSFIGMSSSDPWWAARFTSGHLPRSGSQIALESGTAKASGLKRGDTTTVVYQTGARKARVVGIFHAAQKSPGSIIVGIDEATARQMTLGRSGDPNSTRLISVYGTHRLDPAEQKTLAARIRAALKGDPAAEGAHVRVVTGDQYRRDSTSSIRDSVGFVRPVILVFAAIALFVAGFIIANTFSMIVHESMRGYALLRSVGASSAQVFGMVILEAVVLGLIGSGLGIVLGWGLLALISAGLRSQGMAASLLPTAAGIAAGLIVGLLITVLSAALPARQAAVAPPIQAMNATVNPEKPVRGRAITGLVMIVLGCLSWAYVTALATAAANDSAGPTPWAWANGIPQGWPLGIGAALIVIGTIILSPALVSPAATFLGWIPSKIWPVTGRLAMRTISRSKRRTANTATALLIGVALVSCIGTLASSVEASVAGMLGNDMHYDLVAISPTAGSLPDGAVSAIKEAKGIKSISTSHLVIGMTYDGRAILGPTIASQPSLFSNLMTPVTREGNAVAAMKDGELVVGQNIAKDRSWHVGQKVEVAATRREVDRAATQKAIQAYQAQTAAKIQQLMQSGNFSEAQKLQQSASHVDPKEFVVLSSRKTVRRVRVGAIVTNSMYRNAVVVSDHFARQVTTDQMMVTYSQLIRLKPGVGLATGEKRLKKAVKPYYVVQIMNRKETMSMASQMISQILLIIDMLLVLSIIIAAFGVVNTLLLSISERTKEIGLLRAVGTSNGQVRGMIAIEAVILSVLGSVLGMIVGVAAGAVVRLAFASNGLEVLSIPWNQIGLFLLLSILVGLIASVYPASTALRKPVLDAIASDE